MVNDVFDILRGHGFGVFRRFDDIRSKNLNVTGKNLL